MPRADTSPSDISHLSIDRVEIPEIVDFIAHWDALRHDALAPSWAQFDLMDLDPSWVPYLVVADVVHDPLDFIVRFWGTGHVTRKGVDKTGKSVNAAPDFRGRAAYNEYQWVVENKEPLASRSMVNLHEFSNMLPFEQVQVRLPLSDDGVNVHHVISLAVWEKV